MVFLSLGDFFYRFIGENRIVYAPFFVDGRDFPEVELALVEGTVRNSGHFLKAREVREKAGRVVALGTCACFGGVQGLADGFSEETLIRRRFGETDMENAPRGIRRLLPLDSYIKVDAFLPGCPPDSDLLKGFLEMVLAGEVPERPGSTVCSQCRVTSPELPQPGPRRVTAEPPRPGACLLESGYLCMGPLTRDGCGARCPSAMGVPCHGCRGPSDAAMTPAVDILGETVRRLSRATGRRESEVAAAVTDPAHSCYLFCMAEPSLRRRRPGGTAPFIHRLESR